MREHRVSLSGPEYEEDILRDQKILWGEGKIEAMKARSGVCVRISESINPSNFNISMNVTHFIALFVANRDCVTIQTHKVLVIN